MYKDRQAKGSLNRNNTLKHPVLLSSLSEAIQTPNLPPRYKFLTDTVKMTKECEKLGQDSESTKACRTDL